MTFSLLIALRAFFLGKSGIASDRVGDLPRQPSSLTFFFFSNMLLLLPPHAESAYGRLEGRTLVPGRT